MMYDTMNEGNLTPREMEIARFAGIGATNRQIAAQFGISVQTVETHMKRVRAKLGVRSRGWVEAVSFQQFNQMTMDGSNSFKSASWDQM